MKQIINLSLVEQPRRYGEKYALLRLAPTDNTPLPEAAPGAFVQIAVDVPGVFLRRPISVCDIDHNVLTLLVRDAGEGTHRLVCASKGDCFNVVMPLGHGFTLPSDPDTRVLLAGGGVGVAPLLYLGKKLKERGISPTFIQGARSAKDLLLTDEFAELGRVEVTTDDGSRGVHGVVTDHPVFAEDFDMIYCCGPSPMMRAVCRVAREKGIEAEVSLENMMACGLGACLCCVEKTVKGNVCVCTEGPVFNIKELTW